MTMKTEYFDCACKDLSHTLRFAYFEDDEFPELYTEVFLEEKSWYKRLWFGIKYIFGYKTKYGHFGNWMLDEKDIDRLENMLQLYKAKIAERK